MKTTVSATIGFVTFLAGWEIAGRAGILGNAFPPFTKVLEFLASPDHRTLLADATLHTAVEATIGFFLGTSIGVLGAIAGYALPAVAPGLESFGAIVNGIPVIAVGSLCATVVPPAANPFVVAALGTFFIVFVATVQGLHAAPKRQRDLFAVLGARKWITFRRLVAPAALPSVADGARAAAPIAMVGAVIGEWFSSDRGLGPLLINAMQNYQTVLLWSTAVIAATVSALGYLVLGMFHRAAAERYRS